MEESDDDLAEVIRNDRTDRIRYAAPDRIPAFIRQVAAKTGFYIAASLVFAQGRIELLEHVREQSLCVDYHRYGNLGLRADEDRSDTL